MPTKKLRKIEKVDEVFYGLLGVSLVIMLIILNLTSDYRVTFLVVVSQMILWGIHGYLLEKMKEERK